jgi:hypothetical protein
LDDGGDFVWSGIEGGAVSADVILRTVLLDGQGVEDPVAGLDMEYEHGAPVEPVLVDAEGSRNSLPPP